MIKLPHDLQPEFIYQDGDSMVIVAKTRESIFRFYWDGFSESYTEVKVNLRNNIIELSTD